MKKSCETCKHSNECNRTMGIMWGFCNTNYEPKTEERATTNATQSIISNLSAMGANPIIKIRKDSKNIEIRVNAPTIPTQDNNEKENEQ